MDLQDKSLRGELTIQHFVFNKISFERTGFKNDVDDLPASFSVQVEKQGDSHYIVTLDVGIEKKDEFSALASISGYCEIDDNHPQRDIMLKVNAPAIMFPYVRAQLTLLTAQPETEPIVLPVVNFQKIYEKSKENDNKEN